MGINYFRHTVEDILNNLATFNTPVRRSMPAMSHLLHAAAQTSKAHQRKLEHIMMQSGRQSDTQESLLIVCVQTSCSTLVIVINGSVNVEIVKFIKSAADSLHLPWRGRQCCFKSNYGTMVSWKSWSNLLRTNLSTRRYQSGAGYGP